MSRVSTGQVTIDQEACKGCGLCVAVCARQVLHLSSALNQAGYHPAQAVLGDASPGCNACGRCALICPDVCINVYR